MSKIVIVRISHFLPFLSTNQTKENLYPFYHSNFLSHTFFLDYFSVLPTKQSVSEKQFDHGFTLRLKLCGY